ncbi:hypothetical protein HanXRQr2_Chr09g0381021 [Helianthus annuus]|uniref:Uncharacterized protein n=1 Tax=Helianthus annuus TaxID=4232 RepID=A0A9K3I4F0_HELAN|nr:hypothetical protein HanXRQr2_Chr09g0381021 [Helianthus annuus]
MPLFTALVACPPLELTINVINLLIFVKRHIICSVICVRHISSLFPFCSGMTKKDDPFHHNHNMFASLLFLPRHH